RAHGQTLRLVGDREAVRGTGRITRRTAARREDVLLLVEHDRLGEAERVPGRRTLEGTAVGSRRPEGVAVAPDRQVGAVELATRGVPDGKAGAEAFTVVEALTRNVPGVEGVVAEAIGTGGLDMDGGVAFGEVLGRVDDEPVAP